MILRLRQLSMEGAFARIVRVGDHSNCPGAKKHHESCQNLGEYSQSDGYPKQKSNKLEMNRKDSKSRATLVGLGNKNVQVGITNINGGKFLALLQRCYYRLQRLHHELADAHSGS